ncbi:MAG TPA: MFS transporter [Candidatus Methanoperedenaceae archaeon]|nr:MFS transporter [Candidatus Methanoperedenaceae archaeon]
MTITIATFLSSVARAFPVPLLPFFESEFSISHSVAVWIIAASSLSLLASIPMGYISDRYGRKWLIVCGMFLISTATFLSGSSQTAGQLIAFQFLLGLGSAAFIPSSSAIIGDIFPAAPRARAVSITLTGVFSGIVTGFLMAGMLVGTIGWRASFYLVAVLILAAALVVGKLIEEPVKEHIAGASPVFKLNSTIYICTFIQGIVGEGIRTMSPLYMAKYQIGNESIGMSLAAMTAASLVILPLAGRLADRVGRKKPIIAGFLFSVPVIFSFPMVTTPDQFTVVLALLGAGAGISLPATSAYAQDASQRIRGTVLGINHTSWVAGATVSPVLGGILADSIGIGATFKLYALAALVGAGITVALLKEK